MRKNRGALWTTETRAVGAVIYDRPGKCFGFMRTPPSHPHSAFAQRNRFTSHSTLITRSSGLRGIRRVVLPQRGQSTGTPIATLSSSARERQSPLLIEPPTAWCGSMRPTRRNYDQPSPLAGVGSLLRARGVARCSLIYAAIESTASGRPVPERTAGLAVAYALVRQISPSTSGMPTSEKTRSTREPSRCVGRAGAGSRRFHAAGATHRTCAFASTNLDRDTRSIAYCCNRRSGFSLIARHLDNRSTAVRSPAKMCPFYRTTRVTAVERRRVPRDNGGAPPPVDAPWCAHLYTPVTRFAATAFAGGWRKLLCGGDLGRCEVIPNNRPKI
jgi:hypothetical protein